jgi:nicotinamidase-related amidase
MGQARDWGAFCLLLIDMQQDSWDTSLAREFPAFETRVRELLSFCRSVEIEVVHIQAAFEPNKSDWMPPYVLKGHIPYCRGTGGPDPLPYAGPEAGERVFVKQSFDAFCVSELSPYLQSRGKRIVLVAGLLTSVCVLFTAVSAMQNGYLTAVVEDCCADQADAHRFALDHYGPIFLQRVRVAELVERHSQWMKDLALLDRVRS